MIGMHKDFINNLAFFAPTAGAYCVAAMACIMVFGGVTYGMDLEVSGDVQFRYGTYKGFVQTPAGGQPGTTSPGRPTLEELDIRWAESWALTLQVRSNRHSLGYSPRFVRLQSYAVLQEDLISQGSFFPAGESIHSSLKLDWHPVAYRYHFRIISDEDRKRRFELAPGAGAGLFDFRYQLHGGTSQDVDRGYANGFLFGSLDLHWDLTDRISLIGHGLVSIPVSEMAQISSFGLDVAYTSSIRHVDLTMFLGVRGEFMRYDDAHKQMLPNRIRIDAWPIFVVGAGFTW